MILLKNEDGFTLIEVLVGINIALITVTIIVSFYLFSSKFVTSVSSGIIKRNELSTCLQKASELIETSECFEIMYNNYSCILALPGSDSIKINSKSISVKDIYVIEDIKGAEVKVVLADENEIINAVEENGSTVGGGEGWNTISSAEIKSITITFIKDKSSHSVCCTLPNIAERRFRNISINEANPDFE